MTTWSAHTFTRVLAELHAFVEASPELAAKARADFPETWDPERYPWMDTFLAAWRMHGKEDTEGHTAAEVRLLKQDRKLSRAERAILAALAASWCSVFEVEEVLPWEGLRLRDLLLDEAVEVRDQNLTLQVARGDGVLLWVIPVEDHLELVGAGVLIPHAQRKELIATARRELAARPDSGDTLGRRRQARRLAPFLLQRVLELFTAEEQRRPLLEPPELPQPPARRRAFQDTVSRRPRRNTQALKPGSAYVFKLGPIDLALEGRVSFYVAVDADGALMAPHTGRKDAEGLQAVAHELKGRTLYCEGRLARAGAPLGYVSRPMPLDVAMLRAMLAVQMYWGPENRAGPPLEVMQALLDGAADLILAAPWEDWTNEEVFSVHLDGSVSGTRELSVLGNGGSEFGFALFDQAGSVERLSLSPHPEEGLEVLVPDSLGLTLDDAPAWAVKAVQQATGVPFVPSVLRVLRNTPRLGTAEEVLVSAAVARALALARPEEREVEVEVRAGDLRVQVRLEIPLPLLSGRYVGPALLKTALRHRPSSRRPRREVPTRKVSETLLEFAQPLLEEAETVESPRDDLFVILALAMSAWNAVVHDTWEPEKDRVERARAALRRLPADDREQMTRDFELLVKRKHQHFADDPRLFDDLEVTERGGPGDLNVRLIGVVAPGAWAEFLGG